MSTFVTSLFLNTLSELFKICRESKTSKVLPTNQLSSDLVNVGVMAGWFDMEFPIYI